MRVYTHTQKLPTSPSAGARLEEHESCAHLCLHTSKNEAQTIVKRKRTKHLNLKRNSYVKTFASRVFLNETFHVWSRTRWHRDAQERKKKVGGGGKLNATKTLISRHKQAPPTARLLPFRHSNMLKANSFWSRGRDTWCDATLIVRA